jgi:hypothetical protein
MSRKHASRKGAANTASRRIIEPLIHCQTESGRMHAMAGKEHTKYIVETLAVFQPPMF